MWPFTKAQASPVIRLFQGSRASACAAIHAKAFHQGWSAQEIADLAAEPSVLAHVALDSTEKTVLGFSLARSAGQEAEILTIVIDPGSQGGGLGRLLLQTQLDAMLAREGQGWVIFPAGLVGDGTACVEGAAARRVDGAGHIALQLCPLLALARIRR